MSRAAALQQPHARIADHPIDGMFLDRWSPRAFDASPLDREELLIAFEAARWAPSAYNYQPWRFLFATRGDADWDAFLQALLPFNRAWAQHASALVFLVSDQLMDDGKPDGPSESRTASFDAGAAWASFAFQAIRLGLHTRGMAGFDPDHAREALAIPRRFRIEAAIAVGRKADASTLPDNLQGREAPTQRRPLSASVFAGRFGNPIDGG